MDEARKQIDTLAALAGDVHLSSPADGDSLHYDQAEGKWVNGYMIRSVRQSGAGGISILTGGAVMCGAVTADEGWQASFGCSGAGSVAIGRCQALLYDSAVTVTGQGSLAVGCAQDNDIFVSGDGSFAGGHVAGGDGIVASGNGCLCFGYNDGMMLSAESDGAVVLGLADTCDAVAMARGAVQIGSGMNLEAKSLQVGGGSVNAAAIHLLSSAAGPAETPHNGMMWIDASGRLCVYSGGAKRRLKTDNTWESYT